MSAKWIQESAEEEIPSVAEQGGEPDWITRMKRAAFIAGVELGIAKAARLAELNEDDDLCQADCHEADARAIRALGSPINNEED